MVNKWLPMRNSVYGVCSKTYCVYSISLYLSGVYIGYESMLNPRCKINTKVKWVKLLSGVRLLATPWAAAYQAPLSVGFSRQEYHNGFNNNDMETLSINPWNL